MAYNFEKEKREAIDAGNKALESLHTAKENLDSAHNWGFLICSPEDLSPVWQSAPK